MYVQVTSIYLYSFSPLSSPYTHNTVSCLSTPYSVNIFTHTHTHTQISVFSQHTVPVASTTSLTLLLVTAMMEKWQLSFNSTPTGSDSSQDDSTCIIVYVLCLLRLQGIACNLESSGSKFLHQATLEVIGKSEPHSVCGGLPLVRDLQDAVFDVQVSCLQLTCSCVLLLLYTSISSSPTGVWLWLQSCVSWRQWVLQPVSHAECHEDLQQAAWLFQSVIYGYYHGLIVFGQ